MGQGRCPGSLTGRVVGADTGEPLPGATVFSSALQTGAVVDTAGFFRLSGVCPGDYTLTYAFVGYGSQVIRVHQGSDSLTTLPPVRLVPSSQTLNEVVVTEHRSEARQLLQTQTSLGGSALDATRGQTLGESLKSLPGLNSIQTGPSVSKPVIHGLYSNRIITLNNGVRQEDQQWGSEHAPQIDPFLASRITVIKGAASIRYGSDAIGGVILVEPRALPSVTGVGGDINLVGGTNGRQQTASGLVEQALGKGLTGLSWRLQGTLKRVGYAQTPAYYLENSSYRETNYSAAVGYTRQRAGIDLFYSQFATRVGLFTGAQVGSLADFYAAIARPEPLSQPGFSYALDRPYQYVTHTLLRARAYLRSDRWGTFTATLAQQQNQRQEYDRLSFSRTTDPELYLRLTTQTADLLWEHAPIRTAGGGRWSGSAGLSGITQGNVRRFLFLIPNYRNYGVGLFALERYARNRWTLEGGLRYDYRWLRAYFLGATTNAVTAQTRHWQNLSGSLAATYQLRPQLAVSGTLSTAFRAPTVSDLYSDGLHQSAVAYERGNPNLRPEQALNANLGIDYTGSRLRLELGLYSNRIANYIYLKPDSVPIVRQRGAFPAYTYNQVLATFRGLDATFQYKLTPRLSLLSRSSLLFAYDHTNANYLVYIPANRTDNALRYDVISADKADSRRISGLYLSVSSLYVARQNRAPAVSQRLDSGQLIFTGDFAPPPAAYTLLGAELGFRWQLGGQPLHVILTGTNLLNRAYRDYLDRFRYFADEPGRNLMLKLRLPLGQLRTGTRS